MTENEAFSQSASVFSHDKQGKFVQNRGFLHVVKNIFAWSALVAIVLFDFAPAIAQATAPGFEPILDQDYSWGVLAMNTDKSVYRPGEKGEIYLAVLDHEGKMVCDADLKLRLTNLSNGQYTDLSTAYGSIQVIDECQSKEFSAGTDFLAETEFLSEGIYRIELVAQTDRGARRIVTYTEVTSAEVPFVIKRSAPTRVFPFSEYKMTMEITAAEDFTGRVYDRVPEGFAISDVRSMETITLADGRKQATMRIGVGEGQIASLDGFQMVPFEATMKAGETATFSYKFTPPTISPYFYELGPINFYDGSSDDHYALSAEERVRFTEPRTWQIAVDDFYGLHPSSGDGTTTGWTSTAGSFYSVIDEEVETPNDADYISGPNVSDSQMYVLLSDPPADFDSATAVNIKARHIKVTNGNDPIGMYYSVVESNESTAITAEAGFAAIGTTWTTTASSTVSVTGTNTKANWTSARLMIRQDWTKSGGTDGSTYGRVSAVEVNLTYTPTEATEDLQTKYYRWRNDDGNETGASWEHPEDSSNSGKELDPLRLRFSISNGGTLSTTTYLRIQYGVLSTTCGAIGTWVDIPTSATSQAFEMVDSSYFTDGDATTNQLTAGNTTFTAGKMKDTSNTTASITLGTTNYTEVEYAFEGTNNINTGTTYCFRLTNQGSATKFTYSKYPQITMYDGYVIASPNGDYSTSGWTTATGTTNYYTQIYDRPDFSDDDTTYVQGPNGSSGTMMVSLSNMPADFASSSSVIIKAKHKEVSDGDDTITMQYRVYQSDGTTPLTAETTFSTLTANSYRLDSETVTVTGTNSETVWNGALLQISQTYTRSGPADTTSQGRVTSVEVIIIYIPVINTFGGTVYASEGGSNVGSGVDVNILVDGATTTSATTNASGVWSATMSSVGSGQILTFYIDDHATYEGVTVMISDGADKSDIHLYAGVVAVRDEEGAGFNNVNLSTTDNGDTDIKYTVSGVNDDLTVNSGFELHVWDGTNFYMTGGGLTTQGSANLHIGANATARFSAGLSSSVVDGDIVMETNSTAVIDDDITVNGGSVNASGLGNIRYTAGETGGQLTMAGTGSVIDSAGASTTVYSLVVASAANITFASTTVATTVTGNGVINHIEGTFTVNGTTFGGDSNWTFTNLVFGGAATSTGTGSITATSTLTVSSGASLGMGGKTWSLSGSTPISNSGTINVATSTISYEQTSGTLSLSTITSYYNLQFAPASGSATFELVGAAANWYDNSWGYRKPIEIDYTKVTGASGHSNFPMLFSVTDSSLKSTGNGGNVASTTAGDIVFVDWDGNKMDHEVESYDATTGAFNAWVRMPFLSSTSTYSIYIYYGNASASYQPTNESVWDSNYLGVWHLNNTASTTDSIRDSTSYNHDGLPESPTTTSGRIDGAWEFDGLDDRIMVTDTVQLDNVSSAFSTEAWVYDSDPHDQASDDDRVIISKGDLGNSANTTFRHRIVNLSGAKRQALLIGDGATSQEVLATAGTFGFQTWTHLVATYDGTNINLYRNGASDVTQTARTIGTPLKDSANLPIGGQSEADCSPSFYSCWKGKLDEVRLSKVARSGDWVTTQYANMSATSTFYTVQTEEQPGAGAFVVANNLILGGAGAATLDVDTNDPVLDVNGSVTIGSGDTLSASASATTTVAGNFTNSGTFTHNNGTIKFDGSSNATSTISGATTFYNFFATSTSHHLAFGNGAEYTFASGGTFTVLGESGAQLNIYSDSYGSQWTINVQGTAYVTYANVRDGACNAGSSTIDLSDDTSTDSGNNGSCWGFSASAAVLYVLADQTFDYAQATTTISTITVNDPSGSNITTGNDIRIRIAPQFNMVWNMDDTAATIGGSASGKASATVSFPDSKTLLVDVTTNFSANDSITISNLGFSQFDGVESASNTVFRLYTGGAADADIDDTATSTATIKGTVTLADHDTSQESDALTVNTSGTGIEAFAFSLTPNGEKASSTLTINYSSTGGGIVQGDLSSAKIFWDENGDGALSGEGVQLWGDGSIGASSIAFTSTSTATSSANYIMTINIANLLAGDDITFSLGTSNVYSVGTTSVTYASPLTVSGSITDSTHTENNDNVAQKSWRWVNDDGATIAANTAAATAGSPLTSVKKGQRQEVRFQVDNTGASPTTTPTYYLQFATSESGPWTDVGVETAIRYTSGLSGANNAAITSAVASTTAYSFVNGTWHEATNVTNGTVSLDNNEYSEVAFMIDTFYAAENTTYFLRLQANDGSTSQALDSYSAYPHLTTVSSANNTLRYSKDAQAAFSNSTSSLVYYFDASDYSKVSVSDNTYATTTASSNIPQMIFATRTDAPGRRAKISWEGRSTVAPATSNVHLDAYRLGSLNSWTSTSTNSSNGADSDFTLTNTIDSNVSEYYEFRDGGYWYYFRISQDSSSGSLQTDNISVTFSDFPSATSTADQTFTTSDGTTAISPITITEGGAPAIKAANDIKVTIPAGSGLEWDTGDSTPSFSGTASGKVGSVLYTDSNKSLVIDVTEDFAAGDTLIIDGLSYTSFTASPVDNLEIYVDGYSTDTVADQTDSKTIGVRGTSDVAEPTTAATNQFDIAGTGITDKVLYTFQLTPAGEDVDVTSLIIRLENISSIETADLSSLALYVDYDSDGVIDGGETQVGGAGTPSISGSNGTITFSSSFTATTTRDYILSGSVNNLLDAGEGMKVAIYGADITADGSTSAIIIPHASNASKTTHNKPSSNRGGNAVGGGNGGGNAVGGGGASGGSPTGGGDGGGSSQGGGSQGGGGASP